jgi:hypothetical protein
MNTIFQIAQKNGYTLSVINHLNNWIMNAKCNLGQGNICTKNSNKWITFEYHSPLIRKATNILKIQIDVLHIVYQTQSITY